MKTWQDWEDIHQPFELRYHVREGIAWCSDPQFHAFWGDIFSFMGGVDLGGKRIDVGCGPRPPFGEGSTAIDPLLEHYRTLCPEWWNHIDGYAVPAERLISKLTGKFDTVLCWNCLDHTIGWKKILANLRAYGNEAATYAIATDFKPPSLGHPGFDRDEFFTELERYFRIVKQAENFQERDVALVLAA